MGIFHFGVGIEQWPLKIIGQNRAAADQDQKQQGSKLKRCIDLSLADQPS